MSSQENLVLSAASGGKQKGNTSVHLWDISQVLLFSSVR